MKDNEIVQALRCCAKGLGHDDACENCKVGEIQDRREYIEFAAANVIERLTAENAVLREKNWGCRQQMSEKLYGAYLTSVQNVREAKLELAKQAAQCVERAMLDDDMFLVKGDTVGW